MESRFNVHKPMQSDIHFSFLSLRNTAPGKQPCQTVQQADKVSHLCRLLSPVEGNAFQAEVKMITTLILPLEELRQKEASSAWASLPLPGRPCTRPRWPRSQCGLQHGAACQGKLPASSSRGSRVFLQLGKVSLHQGELHFSAFALKGKTQPNVTKRTYSRSQLQTQPEK